MDGSIRISTKLETKGFEKQLEQLRRRLNVVNHMLQNGDKYKLDTSSIKKYQVEAEKLTNKIVSLEQQQLKLSNTGENVGKGFNKGLKSLTKFGFALIGIRTALNAVNKSSSIYLSGHEQTANKLAYAWKYLASIIGPVIEVIANGVLKLIGYINEFVKALTGKDFIKITNDNIKAIEKQNKAQEKLNNTTASFDEFSTVSNDSNIDVSSSGNSSLDFEMPTLNDDIVNKLKDIAGWLLENKKLLGDVAIALGVAFAVSKILDFTNKVKTLSKTLPLLNKTAITFGLTTVAIGLWKKVYDLWVNDVIPAYKDLTKQTEINNKVAKEQADNIKELNNLTKDKIKNNELTVDQENKIIEAAIKRNNTVQTHIDKLNDENFLLKLVNGGNSAYHTQLVANKDMLESNNKVLEEAYNQGRLNYNQTLDYIKSLNDEIEIKRLLGEDTKNLKIQYEELCNQLKINDEWEKNDIKNLTEQIKKMDTLGLDATNLKKKYEELTGKKYETTIETKPKDSFTGWWNNLWNSIKNTVASINGNFSVSGSSGGAGGGGGRFAVGGIVSQPVRTGNITLGEEGVEAILPLETHTEWMDVLASRINGGNNSETNALLRELISKIGNVTFTQKGSDLVGTMKSAEQQMGYDGKGNHNFMY